MSSGAIHGSASNSLRLCFAARDRAPQIANRIVPRSRPTRCSGGGLGVARNARSASRRVRLISSLVEVTSNCSFGFCAASGCSAGNTSPRSTESVVVMRTRPVSSRREPAAAARAASSSLSMRSACAAISTMVSDGR